MIRIAFVSFLCCKIVVLLVVGPYCHGQSVFVTTKYGTVRGLSVLFPNNYGPAKRVNVFLGIPFASPPVGKLRLKPPVPPCMWKPGIYNATQYGNVCIQDEIHAQQYRNVWPSFDPKSNIAEDCLYLNIYAPDLKASHPVMVYIHGGGFNTGSSLLSPGYQLARRGVIVVTIQYRLGPLGFISTGDKELPGNYGLLDQVQALKWVRENIHIFHGNPREVTLFGSGAGAASIGFHLLSPLSKGLFHRVALESGFDLAPWPIQNTKSTLRHSKALAESLGCYQRQSRDLLDCLQKINDPKNFLKANALFSSWGLGTFSFGPVVDKIFLPGKPSALRRHGLFSKVPLIAGITANESSLYMALKLKSIFGVSNISCGIDHEVFNSYCEKHSTVLQPRSSRHRNMLFDALSFEYYPWYAIQDDEARLQSIIDIASDYYYGAPIIAALIAHSRHAPSYMFVFNHRSRLSPDPSWAGVPHGSSSCYVLGLVTANKTSHYDKIDNGVSDVMVTMWTNMAKHGNPTPRPVQGITWDQFSATNHVYLRFDGQPVAKMASNFHGSRAAFWNNYYPKMMTESLTCPGAKVSGGISSCTSDNFIVNLLLVLYYMYL